MFVRPNLIAPRSGDGRTGGTLTILRRGAPTNFASHSEHRRRDARCGPKIQVYTMPADKFFAYAADLLKMNHPHITDEPMIAQLKKIGIEPGKSFDLAKADPATRNALANAAEEGQKLMEWKLPTLARVAYIQAQRVPSARDGLK